MVCFTPLKGWRSKTVNPKTGKRKIVYNPQDGYVDMPQIHPCGQCLGCRIDRSRSWAVRCVHESKLYAPDHSYFLTLTFNDEHIPEDRCVNKEHVKQFMKRLKSHVRYHNPDNLDLSDNIRFFACGEYGKSKLRPHYHFIIFNHLLTDLKKAPTFLQKSKFAVMYESELINKIWTDPETKKLRGYAVIGEANVNSCAYTARYITKKYLGKNAAHRYELENRTPEFIQMSRNPGIGYEHLIKYYKEIYADDFCLMYDFKGKKKIFRVPRYYDNLLEKFHYKKYMKLKLIREERYKDLQFDTMRAYAKMKFKEQQMKKCVRALELLE